MRGGIPGAVICLLVAGCTTARTSNTARTSTEQLLISSSVDRALAKVDFRPFAHRAIYLEEKYLDAVDKSYIAASVRHQMLHAGSRLVAKPEDAELIVEIRSGGVGTETRETFLGMPAISVPGPLPVSLPEVRLLSRTSQTGTAKIGLVAYDARTRAAMGTGGVVLSQSNDNNWYVMGIGPWRSGSVRKDVARQDRRRHETARLPAIVAFTPDERHFKRERSGRIRLATGERDR
ncbi:MAG: DUF6655 family protein [Planctomycetaceae bacterium]